MADINVDVSLPNSINVNVTSPTQQTFSNITIPAKLLTDTTSPTQSLVTNVSVPGPQGPAGIQGPSGAIGPSGAVGPSGAQGPIGPSGLQGPVGPIGPSGAVGPSGLVGPSGVINTGQFDLRYYSINNPSGFITGVNLSNYYTRDNPSGFVTGVDLSSYITSSTASSTYATITNLASTGSTLATHLASTGSTLDTKINTLSGSSVLIYGNQSIGGVKTFRDNIYINNLFVTGTETIVSTNNFNVQSPYLILNLTGGAVDGGIFFITGSGLTGVNDTGPIIGFDHSKNFKFGVSTRNSDLSTLPDIASVQDIQAYSGVADNKFSTITNLASTGNTLEQKISSLSGTLTSTYATITNLASTGSTLVTNLASTGSTLQTNINNLSNTYATITNLSSTGSTLSTNLASTGSTLNSSINSLSGTLTSTYATITNLASTGNTLVINLASTGSTLATNLANTGSTLQTNINNLSSTYATITNLASTGSTLNSNINSLSGTLTGNYLTTSSASSTYATITNLASTGSTLQTNINNLSGYINSTSSNIVFTTGNQTINGLKTFNSGVVINVQPTGTNPAVYITGTWSNANQIYTGISLSISGDSDANSLLMDLKSGASTRFSVKKDGTITFGYASIAPAVGWQGALRIGGGSLNIGNAGNYIQLPGGALLRGDTNHILEQYNGTNPQQFRVYNRTGTNSGEYGLFGWDTGNNLIIGSQATSSGILRDTNIVGKNININPNSGSLIINVQQTGTSPAVYISGAWNNTGQIYTGLFLNINDNNSNSSSELLNIRFSGKDFVQLQKNGKFILNSPYTASKYQNIYFDSSYMSANFGIYGTDGGYSMILDHGGPALALRGGFTGVLAKNYHIAQNGFLGFGTSTSVSNPTWNPDVLLYRDSSGVLAQRNGTSAQQFRVYNSTGTNSGEFGLFGWQNNNLIIGSQATNSGISRDVLITGNNVLLSGNNINITNNGAIALPSITEPQTFGNNFVGMYNGNGQIVFSAGSTRVAAIGQYSNTAGIGIAPTRSLFFATSDRLAGGNFVGDIYLTRNSAGVINQASSTTPQQYRIFNITGTNTGEFGLVGWVNSGFVVGPQQTSSGILRDLTLTGNNININASGSVTFPSITTTASAANAFLDNTISNTLLRSTSSMIYKENIEDLTTEEANKILNLRPITFSSKSSYDDKNKRFFGLIAEEVDQIEPKLVQYTIDSEGNKIPDGVQYDRLTVLLIAKVQELQKEIDILKSRF